MATISNTPRPGYAWDATDNCWYPIGTGPHTHSDYITQSTAINPATITTKGDLIVGTGNGTLVRQGVGTNGQVLTANSAQADGVEWTTPVSGSMTLLASGSLASGTTTISSIDQSYNNLVVYVYNYINAGDNLNMRINGTSTAGDYVYVHNDGGTSWTAPTGRTYIYALGASNGASDKSLSKIEIPFYSSTAGKTFTITGGITDGATTIRPIFVQGICKLSTAVTSITLFPQSGTISGGTYAVYGVK